MLYVCIPDLAHLQVPTKREVSSALGKLFDVLGWFSPSNVQMKIHLQLTWKTKLGRDEPLPSSMLNVWAQWKDELPLLSSHDIPRRFTSSDSPVLEFQLHGFSDTSQTAYGGPIYLRALHQDTSISMSIVTTKTKVQVLRFPAWSSVALFSWIGSSPPLPETSTFPEHTFMLGVISQHYSAGSRQLPAG